MRKKKRSSGSKLVVVAVVGNYGAVVGGVVVTIPTMTVPFLFWLLRTAVSSMRMMVDSHFC